MINSDWEGPWVTADHARAMVEFAVPQIGGKVFDRISEYDDWRFYIVKGNSYGDRKYEVGDTLGLIAPILIAFDVTEKDLIDVAKKNANFINGAIKSINFLKRSHELNIVTTSYVQYVEQTAKLAGISKQDVFGTHFPINEYSKGVDEKDKKLVKNWMPIIAKLPRLNIGATSKKEDLNKEQLEAVKKLDYFFFELLPQTSFKNILYEIKPIGGSRKLEAVLNFLKGKKLSDAVTIGDSMTDVVMLEETKKVDGLALCFNGNDYAMHHSNFSIVADNCIATAVVADIFENSDIETLRKIVKNWSIKELEDAVKRKILSEQIFMELKNSYPSKLMKFPIVYDLKDGKNLDKKIEISKHFRNMIRGKEIGSLG
jgi:predicted HAD superfamily phosphohydrolase